MSDKHTVSIVRIDSINGVLSYETLYSSDRSEFADRLTEYIKEDWEGTKHVERVRNARAVIITSLDKETHEAACARIDGRKNGMSARKVEMGQSFATVTACAQRLGVTAAAISKELNKPRNRPYTPGEFATVKIRGATIAYLDEYQLAMQQNSSD